MVNSSLAYEILLYINSFYFGLFAACEISSLILKGVSLNEQYTTVKIAQEAGIMVALVLVESLRIYLGRKGCLQNRDLPVIFSVPLTIPSLLGVIHLLINQQNIIKMEYMWCTLMFILQSTELVFGLFFLMTMCRAPSYD